jgi:4'-phosphopantetheinyl transferase
MASARGLPELDPARVEVWCAAVDVLQHELGRMRPVLDPAERARADRLRFPRDRDRFVAAHVFLRVTLGRYLGIAPGDVRLSTGPRGKPSLQPAPGSPRPQFNLSHCDGLAVLAVSLDRAVGVDVERIRPGFDYAPIVETAFGAAERAWLRAHDAGARETAFFAAWTRKEALAKAAGTGLEDGLDATARATADGGWRVCAISPAPGYAGAVAAEGAGWRAACRAWRPGAWLVGIGEPAA